MADSFGLKIGVEGEKEFKQALREINDSFKVLGSEMKLVSAQFDKNDNSVKALTARNTVLNSQIEEQKNKINALKSALDNAEKSFGKNDSRTKSWQTQLNNAQAGLVGMENQLRSNNSALQNAERGFNSSAKTAKDFSGAVKDAEQKTSSFGDVLKANLATEAIKAGLSALLDVIKQLGSAIGEYLGSSMQMAADTAMTYRTLEQVMGNMMGARKDEVQSIIDLAAAQEQLGVVSKTAQVSALAELATFVERKESLEEFLPVMNDYIASQYQTGASAEQARNMATSLGKAIQGNISGLAKQGFILSDQDKEWFKYATEMERVAFVADMISEGFGGMNEALAETDAGKMAALITVLDNTKISVGMLANEMKAAIYGEMQPAITSLSEAFIGVLEGTGSVEDMAATFKDVFVSIENVVNNFVPKIVDLAGNVLKGFALGISQNIDSIVRSVTTITTTISETLFALLPTLINAGTNILFGIIQGIVSALPMLAESAIGMIGAIADGLGQYNRNIIPAVVTVISQIATIIVNNIPAIIEAGTAILRGLADGIVAAIPIVIEKIPPLLFEIVASISRFGPVLVQAAASILSHLAMGLADASPLLKPFAAILQGLADGLAVLTPVVIAAAVAFGMFQLVTTVTASIKAFAAAMAASSVVTAAQTALLSAQSAGLGIAATAQAVFNAVVAANPIGAIIVAIAALVAGITLLVGWLNKGTAAQRELNESLEKSVEANKKATDATKASRDAYDEKTQSIDVSAAAASKYMAKIAELNAIENKSEEQKKRLEAHVKLLNKAMGESVVEYDAVTGAIVGNIAEVENLVKAKMEEAKAEAAKLRAIEIAKEQIIIEERLQEMLQRKRDLDDALAKGVFKKGTEDAKYREILNGILQETGTLVDEQRKLETSFDVVTQTMIDSTEAADKYIESNAKVVESEDDKTEKLSDAAQMQSDIMAKRMEEEAKLTEKMIDEANKQGLTLDEYKKKVQEIEKEEKKAYEEREKGMQKYSDKAQDMFKAIKLESAVSFDEMNKTLLYNAAIFEGWSENIVKLSKRGIFDEGLIKHLEAAGPEAARTIAAMNDMTDDQLRTLNTNFANAGESGALAFINNAKAIDGTEAGKKIVGDVVTGMEDTQPAKSAGEKLVEDTKEAVSSTIDSANFESIGKNIALGVAKGITSGKSVAVNAAIQMGNEILKATADNLGIHSESKKFEEKIGANIPPGVAKGTKKNAKKATDAAKKMADDTFKAAELSIKNYENSANYSLQTHYKMLEDLAKGYKEGSDKRVKIETDMRKLQQKISKDYWDSETLNIKEYALQADSTLEGQLSMWSRLRETVKDNQEYRVKALQEETKLTKEIEKEKVDAAKKAEKEKEDLYKKQHESRMNLIKHYRTFDDYDKRAEVNMLKNYLGYYDELSKESIQIRTDIKKLNEEILKDEEKAYKDALKEREKMEKEAFDSAKNWIENRKKTGKLSLAEELKAWELVQTRYVKGSEERKKVDEQVFAAKQKIIEQEKKLNEDIKKTEENYEKQLESRTQALKNSFGIFEELKKKEDDAEKVSGQKLKENLENQVKEMEKWAKNLESLSQKGIDEGLLNELRAMGPKANEEIEALSKMSGPALDKYSELWKKKTALARVQATAELSGLREEADKEITKFKNDLDKLKPETVKDAAIAPAVKAIDKLVAQTMEAVGGGIIGSTSELAGIVPQIIGSMGDSFAENKSLIKSIGADTSESIADGMKDGFGSIMDVSNEIINTVGNRFNGSFNYFQEIGKSIMRGIGAGITSMSKWLDDLLRDYIDNMVKKVENRLQISSPSKVFSGIGGFMAAGIGEGFSRTMGQVNRDIQGAIRIPQLSAGGAGGYGTGGYGTGGFGDSENIVINNNFYTETVTPSKIAKAGQQAARRMVRDREW